MWAIYNLYFIINSVSQLCRKSGRAACAESLQGTAEFLQNYLIYMVSPYIFLDLTRADYFKIGFSLFFNKILQPIYVQNNISTNFRKQYVAFVTAFPSTSVNAEWCGRER